MTEKTNAPDVVNLPIGETSEMSIREIKMALDFPVDAPPVTPTPTVPDQFPGVANWYRNHVDGMNATVLNRHRSDLEEKANRKVPISENDRVEIAQALSAIEGRLDELLPKTPASIDQHDKVFGNRVKDSWPIHASRHSMLVHMHFCELVTSWKLNPARIHTGYVGVNPLGEFSARSTFDFDSGEDCSAFLAYYGLEDFVITQASFVEATQRNYYVTLTNRFAKEDVDSFLNVYRAAVNSLAVIAEERRRAMNIDGGKVGFVTVDHFAAREQTELSRIRAARAILGAGAKVRT